MNRTHFVAVGACAIDNILTVPFFPQEDSKLRAVSYIKRRGGNCPNSLEVLSQLIDKFTRDTSQESPSEAAVKESLITNPKLSLIATLPSHSSPEIRFIKTSFEVKDDATTNEDSCVKATGVPVDISRCVYREAFTEPISSYIICSQATSSRTIVNHNELPEMTVDEFIDATADILPSSTSSDENDPNDYGQFWFHFEGRIPETTLKCIQHLRNHFTAGMSDKKAKLMISVELEKPKREGLQELAYEADVVFYSKSWADAEGYRSAEVCLKEQAKLFANKWTRSNGERKLVCTWGDQGSCALQLSLDISNTPKGADHANYNVLYSAAYSDQTKSVLDTVGAGDTFIAGMLFGFICRSNNDKTNHESLSAFDVTEMQTQSSWTLKHQLEFANELAGRKILQQGFQGLATEVESLVWDLDNLTKQ